MLYIESVNANTFRMYGNGGATKSDYYPKLYAASAIMVPNEDEPRITIKHTSTAERIVNLKKFDEITINGSTFATAEDAIIAFNIATSLSGYLQYSVLLTQTSTNAPVVSPLKVDFAGTVWTRSSAGTYLATNIGRFTSGKTAPNKVVEYVTVAGDKLVLTPISVDQFKLESFASSDLVNPADGVLSGDEVNIFIYL